MLLLGNIVLQASERFERFVAFEQHFRLAGWRGTGLTRHWNVDREHVPRILRGDGDADRSSGRNSIAADRVHCESCAYPRAAGGSTLLHWTALPSVSRQGRSGPTVLLGRFRGAQEVGLYGGVLTLALFRLHHGMLATVLQPRVAACGAWRVAGVHRKFNDGDVASSLIALVLLMGLCPYNRPACAWTTVYGVCRRSPCWLPARSLRSC